MRHRTVISSIVALLVALVVSVGAVPTVATADGTQQVASPTPTDPVTPVTDPVTPVTDPVTPVTTPDGPVNPDDDGVDWLPILLIVLGLVVLVAVVVAIFTRSPRSSTRPQPDRPRPATPVQTELLTTAQWIHDQLSLELLGAEPAAARQRWATERSRVDSAVIGCQQQYAGHQGSGWQQLAQSLAALATAIDTSVGLRVQPTAEPALISESIDVVNRQRNSLQQVLRALWSVTPH